MGTPPKDGFIAELEAIGAPGGRKRWRSKDGKRLFEWDRLHDELEVYNKQGYHLGAMDPLKGTMIKGPEKGRSIDV